jgi:hypothetical protein
MPIDSSTSDAGEWALESWQPWVIKELNLYGDEK